MGGGRKTPQTTTVSGGIDPEFKPYLKQVLADVTDTYKASVDDPSKTVAALDPAQQAALDAQQSQAQDALTGGGAYDYTSAMNKDIQNLQSQYNKYIYYYTNAKTIYKKYLFLFFKFQLLIFISITFELIEIF